MENTLIAPSRTRSAVSLVERAIANDDDYLEPDDPAFRALTDFHCEYPITVEGRSSIHDSLAHMSRLAVHALLVTRQEVESIDEQVIGLVTYHDIERWCSERSPQEAVTNEPAGLVQDVMTPWDELSLVHYDSLAALTALELSEMFRGTGLTHLLVIEMQADDSALARGLISRGSLAKRLRRHRKTANG